MLSLYWAYVNIELLDLGPLALEPCWRIGMFALLWVVNRNPRPKESVGPHNFQPNREEGLMV